MPTPIVSVDQEAIKEDLRELVRRTVEVHDHGKW